MKKIILPVVVLLFALVTNAQTQLVANQNPNYMTSQNKYMAVADSLTSTQSTTVQDTYKAIDYLEDKREAREQRRQYRQQRRYSNWNYGNYGYNDFYQPYGYYNNYRPWSGRQYLNNYLFNTLPLSFTLGAWHRRWY